MRKALLVLTLAAGTAVVFLSGAQQTRYSYTENIAPLFSGECGNCHNWHEDYRNLVGPVSEYAPTTGLPIVNPNRPDSSVVVWRLEGKLPSGENIERMPRFADALPEENIQMVRDWITQGAPDAPVGVENRTWGKVKDLFR